MRDKENTPITQAWEPRTELSRITGNTLPYSLSHLTYMSVKMYKYI